MNIGIIGGTGMLGHHTALAATAQGYDVTLIHRASSDLSKLSNIAYESRLGDLNTGAGLVAAFRGLDMVLNCGAYYPTLPRPLHQELAAARTQTQHFLDAVRQSGVGRALYLGAAIALPKASSGAGKEQLTYAGPPSSKAPYVQVKWLMDEMVRTAGTKQGLPVVIGIPSMTFGEFDTGPTTGRLIVEIANSRMPAYVRGPRNVVYAGDAARGLLLACEKGRPGERYLLTGTNTDMDQLVRLIAECAGVAAPAKVLPLRLAKLISAWQEARFTWFKGPVPQLSSTTIAVLSGGQHLSGRKAKEELGYLPASSLRQTIGAALHWFASVGYVPRTPAPLPHV